MHWRCIGVADATSVPYRVAFIWGGVPLKGVPPKNATLGDRVRKLEEKTEKE